MDGSIIRPATEADVPALLAMGLHFAETVYTGRSHVTVEAIERLGRWLMAEGMLLVAERDGEPVGMLGLCVLPHPMNGQRTCFESFWWVNEDARGLGIRLLHQGEAWARAQGAELMQVVAPDARVERLYERLGYLKIEVAFQRPLTHTQSESMRQSAHAEVGLSPCP